MFKIQRHINFEHKHDLAYHGKCVMSHIVTTVALCNNRLSHFVITDALCNNSLSRFVIPDALCNRLLSDFVITL